MFNKSKVALLLCSIVLICAIGVLPANAAAPEKGEAVLFEEDFASLEDWTFVDGGNWIVQDGTLRQTSIEGYPIAVVGDKSWTNYHYHATFKLKEADEPLWAGPRFLFRYHAPESYYMLMFQVSGDVNLWERTVEGDGGYRGIGAGKKTLWQWDTPITVDILVNGSKIEVYIDGRSLLAFEDEQLKNGCVGLQTALASIEVTELWVTSLD